MNKIEVGEVVMILEAKVGRASVQSREKAELCNFKGKTIRNN